ncbi:phage capsid family protein [Paraburkholderia caribensis]|uniref:phage capsid family protein n=1 Tax=Paraburkholderia caribensis TaxID=75105 RepID=UPI0034D1BE74
MAETSVRQSLTPAQWDDEFFREYVRENLFSKYMGTDEGSIIQIKDALTRKSGDRISFNATRQLRGDGVENNEVLEGNEDELDARSLFVVARPIRNAVVLTDWDAQKSAIDMRDAARYALKDWITVKMRNDIIAGLQQVDIYTSGKPVRFIDATATQRNTWLANNADRVLFGNSVSNNAGNDAAASMANINATTGKLTAATITLAKRRARLAGRGLNTNGLQNPAMTPYTVRNGDGTEWYMMFTGSLPFRDLQNDPVMQQANRDARTRDDNGSYKNPIWTGGDLVYDGVIVREVPELDQYMATGASGAQIGQYFLCGAQALGVAWVQRSKTTTDTRDYGFRNGVGVQEIRGINKLQWGVGAADNANPVDAGIFTGFVSAAADA